MENKRCFILCLINNTTESEVILIISFILDNNEYALDDNRAVNFYSRIRIKKLHEPTCYVIYFKVIKLEIGR